MAKKKHDLKHLYSFTLPPPPPPNIQVIWIWNEATFPVFEIFSRRYSVLTVYLNNRIRASNTCRFFPEKQTPTKTGPIARAWRTFFITHNCFLKLQGTSYFPTVKRTFGDSWWYQALKRWRWAFSFDVGFLFFFFFSSFSSY